MIKYTFNESLADDNNRKNAFRQAVEMWRAAWINRKMIGNPWTPPYFACHAFVFQPHSKPVGSSSWFYMFLWCFNFIEILVWFTCAFQQAEEKEVTSAMYIHYYTLKTLWTQFARLGRLGRLQFFFQHVLPCFADLSLPWGYHVRQLCRRREPLKAHWTIHEAEMFRWLDLWISLVPKVA